MAPSNPKSSPCLSFPRIALSLLLSPRSPSQDAFARRSSRFALFTKNPAQVGFLFREWLCHSGSFVAHEFKFYSLLIHRAPRSLKKIRRKLIFFFRKLLCRCSSLLAHHRKMRSHVVRHASRSSRKIRRKLASFFANGFVAAPRPSLTIARCVRTSFVALRALHEKSGASWLLFSRIALSLLLSPRSPSQDAFARRSSRFALFT